MTPEELRIGNWVNVGHFDANSKVKAVFEGKIICGIVTWDTESELVNPIPLTPEILEKCGFNLEAQRQSIYIKKRLKLWMGHTGCIAYLKHEDNDTSFWIGDCKYLHQLQNLFFCLVGEELKVKL